MNSKGGSLRALYGHPSEGRLRAPLLGPSEGTTARIVWGHHYVLCTKKKLRLPKKIFKLYKYIFSQQSTKKESEIRIQKLLLKILKTSHIQIHTYIQWYIQKECLNLIEIVEKITEQSQTRLTWSMSLPVFNVILNKVDQHRGL